MAKQPDIVSSTDRFQLRDAPGQAGKTVASFATREEADEALVQQRQELPGVDFAIVDMGVRPAPTEKDAFIEATKTAEQKRLDQEALDAHKPEQSQRA